MVPHSLSERNIIRRGWAGICSRGENAPDNRCFATVFGATGLSVCPEVSRSPLALYLREGHKAHDSIYRLESVFYPTNFLQADIIPETHTSSALHSACYKNTSH
jgi:hypothetical protein